MATTRQKESARRNVETARQARSSRARGADPPSRSHGLSTAEKDRLAARDFAFPKERKEPLVDVRHVRNAVVRFGQVEGVTDTERDEAWRRIRRAAKRFDVHIDAEDWRDLSVGGKKAVMAEYTSPPART